MNIHLCPISKFCSTSKLAIIIDRLGWKTVPSPEDSDILLWITDGRQPDAKFYNWRDTAIDKQRVNDVFEQVFGYPVEVDPETYHGKAVEKKLDHGTHGRVVNCPTPRQKQRCYQKLLYNLDGKLTEELRLDVFRSEMILTVKFQVKRKDGMPQELRTVASSQFDVPLDWYFNVNELGLIQDFCAVIGLDYGSLDVIRHVDGKLYVIDATTNIGVPEMDWHIDLTMAQYIGRQAKAFERNFCL